jgi:hypothetical protein
MRLAARPVGAHSAIAMVFAIVMLSLAEDYSYYRSPATQDWRGAMDYVGAHSQPTDALIVYPAYYTGPMKYYIPRRAHPESFPTTVFLASVAPGSNSPERLLATSGLAGTRRIWFTFPTWDPSGHAALRLLRHVRVIDEPQFAGVRLFLLERGPDI